jgi:hypothetical protein
MPATRYRRVTAGIDRAPGGAEGSKEFVVDEGKGYFTKFFD